MLIDRSFLMSGILDTVFSASFFMDLPRFSGRRGVSKMSLVYSLNNFQQAVINILE